MNRIIFRAALAASVAAVCISAVQAQTLSRVAQADWTNAGSDAQHTNWLKTDAAINVAAVSGGKAGYSSPDSMSGWGLQWKSRLAAGKATAVVSGGVSLTSAGLGLNMGMVNVSSGKTVGFDMDTGRVYYSHTYAAGPAATATCAGALIASPARPSVFQAAAPAPAAARAATPPVFGEGGVITSGRPTSATTASAAPGVGLPQMGPQAPRGGAAAPAAGNDAVAAPAPAAVPAAGAAGRAGRGAGGGGARGAAAPAAGAAAAGAAAAAPAGRAAAGNPRLTYGAAALLAGQGTNSAGAGGGSGSTYAVSADGKMHELTNQYGLDAVEPMAFLPNGAQPTDLTVVKDVAYTSTVNGCGGAANGVWGIGVSELPRGPGSAGGAGAGFGGAPAGGPASASALGTVTSWKTGGTSSPSAVSFGTDGTAYVTTSAGTGSSANSVVALNAPGLTVKGTFTKAGADFVGPPVIFAANGADIIAAQAHDGTIYLLNGALSAPLATAPGAGKAGGLATWVDESGQRWLLTATATSVVAYKVTVNGSSASLSQAWTVSGLSAPLTPIVDNGVVFIASTAAGKGMLYAVDGTSGNKLWNSGSTITGTISSKTKLWPTVGQVMVSTTDGTVWAFGTNMERHF